MNPPEPETDEAVPAVPEDTTPDGRLACVGFVTGLPAVALLELAMFAPLVMSAVFGFPTEPCDWEEAPLAGKEFCTEGLPRVG